MIQAILQKLLGFERYLFWFSVFKVKTLRWDKKEGDLFGLVDLLPENGVVLDIGANLGFMTVILAQKCFNGKVFSFEPIPENFRAAGKAIAYFHLTNVKLFNIALGARKGNLEMVMPEKNEVRMQGLSHVLRPGEVVPEGKRYSVPVERLDDLAELKENKITGIKIDVEEFESFVFEGGLELLRRDRPVVYAELWDSKNREACFSIFPTCKSTRPGVSPMCNLTRRAYASTLAKSEKPIPKVRLALDSFLAQYYP